MPRVPADYYVRPMTLDDVAAVERLSDETFLDLDTRTHRPGWPAPTPRGDARSAAWRERVAHLVAGDPRGCWVAEDGSGLLGAAVSMRRDLTWLLATYVDDLSNWYVRRSRRRFWSGDPAALATLHECMYVLTLLLAPTVSAQVAESPQLTLHES